MKKMCSYWQRQEFRSADHVGFGYTPPTDEVLELEKKEEDEEDPMCGVCQACDIQDHLKGE